MIVNMAAESLSTKDDHEPVLLDMPDEDIDTWNCDGIQFLTKRGRDVCADTPRASVCNMT